MNKQDNITPLEKEQVLINQVASGLKYIFRYGGLACIIYAWYLMLALADEYTIADMTLRYANTLPISQGVAYLLGIFGLLFGLAQHRLSKRKTTHLSARIHVLEQRLETKHIPEQEPQRV